MVEFILIIIALAILFWVVQLAFKVVMLAIKAILFCIAAVFFVIFSPVILPSLSFVFLASLKEIGLGLVVFLCAVSTFFAADFYLVAAFDGNWLAIAVCMFAVLQWIPALASLKYEYIESTLGLDISEKEFAIAGVPFSIFLMWYGLFFIEGWQYAFIDEYGFFGFLLEFGGWNYFGYFAIALAYLFAVGVFVEWKNKSLLLKSLNFYFSKIAVFRFDDALEWCVSESEVDVDFIEVCIEAFVGRSQFKNNFTAYKVSQDKVVFLENDWYSDNLEKISSQLREIKKNTAHMLVDIYAKNLGLKSNEAQFFVEHYNDKAELRSFDDGLFYVSNHYVDQISVCASCGKTAFNHADAVWHREWFCSDFCSKTESICEDIRSKSDADFLASAASAGFIVMSGAYAWSKNHKMVASGGQGHGFAAENVNNMADNLKLKSAKIIGDTNIKHGADRLVDGQLIQTKYYDTAARSVGAAFDGQNGIYKYVDSTGKPMLLEVPKDQYSMAVKHMEKRIADGKVHGVTDPEQAKKLVVAGSVTYDQARNITKFGTFESIAYDAAEGVVVGISAGGISFAISTSLYYLKTQDPKEALRVGVLTAGKTFVRSMSVYVVSQQLHRLALVQSSLKFINLSAESRNVLAKGMGVSSNQVNNVLRGTVITSAALVVVISAPDLLRLVRGKISSTHFFVRVGVATSSVAGGAVGAVAGGVALAPLGPVGIYAGKFLGGMLGGMLVASIANSIGDSFLEKDRKVAMNAISQQVQVLALMFTLTEVEMDKLMEYINKNLNDESLYRVFKADNKIALANLMLKPVVVGMVRQRPSLSYDSADVVEVVNSVANMVA